MKIYCKISKPLCATLIFVLFFSLGHTATAQTVGNNIDLSGCATEVVSGLLASSLASMGTSAVSGLNPRTLEGGILLNAVALQAAAVAEGTVATAIAVPVNDMAANAHLAVSNVISNADATFNAITKMNLDAVAYGVAQCTLTAITDNTIKWIQGGFTGSPNFAVDTTNLFQKLSDAVLLDLSNQIKSLKACDFTPNFINDLANSVEISAPKRNKLAAKIQCPFGAANISASQFYGPGSRFTWGLFETALGDSGNQFAVRVTTAEEAARRQTEAKAATDQRLSWSNGFADIIDYTNCDYPDAEIEAQANDPSFSPALREMYQRQYCPTTTPGKIVGDSLMKAIGAKQDRIGFADNMNKIISALIHELTKEAISGIFTAANNATPKTGPSHNPSIMTGTPTTGGTGGTTTILAPVVIISTAPASPVGSTSATLNGFISSVGTPDSGNVWFEWGKTTALGSSTPSSPYTAGATAGIAPYSQPLTGLSTSTAYYFRAFGQSTNRGTTYGPIMNFSTTP